MPGADEEVRPGRMPSSAALKLAKRFPAGDFFIPCSLLVRRETIALAPRIEWVIASHRIALELSHFSALRGKARLT